MTLQEILNSVRFEDLKSHLIDMDPQAFENLYSFKEAFDALCMMEPKGGIEIPVRIERVIDDFMESLTCLSILKSGKSGIICCPEQW